MKKVALVNVFFPPQTIGGATRVLADNIDGLINRYSDEIELVGFTTQADCRKPYEVDVYPYQGMRVYRVNSHFRENMDWFAEDREFYKIFKNFLEFEKPDIVHFHCVQRMSASVVEAAKDMKVPYFITIHDAWWISDYQFLVDQDGKVYPDGHSDPFAERSYPQGISPVQSLERANYLKKLMAGAEATLHVSESFESLYRKNGVVNTQLTKNGISSHIDWKTKDTSYTDKVVLGHIGGMSDHKGYDIFEKALASADGKKIEALVVDHSKEPFYESVETIGDVTVTFVGRQSQKAIVDLYSRIDVLFAPSKWPESYGLVTREAAACGCWVVASSMGGIGEDVSNGTNGFVIEPELSEVKKIISKIGSDPTRYKKCASFPSLMYSDEQVDTLYRDVYSSSGI